MKTETFQTVVRLCNDDPLTDKQLKQLTNEDMYKLVTIAQAAEMLGVERHHLLHLDIPRVFISRRKVSYRLHDIYAYINSHSEVL